MSMKPQELHLAGLDYAKLSAYLVFYVFYVLAGGFGQQLALIPGVSFSFWPPAGLFLAMLLLHDKSAWLAWVAVAGLAELTCNAVWFHNPIPLALAYFAANALEALTGAFLIRRFTPGQFDFESVRKVGVFAVLGAGVAPVVGATVIAATDALVGKHAFFTIWPLVWLGDSSGLLVSTPLAFGAIQAWRRRESIKPSRLIEASVIAAGILMTGLLPSTLTLTPIVTLPFLIWASARFQIKGTALALAAIAASEALVALPSRLAANANTTTQEIIWLQIFFAASGFSALIVAGLSFLHQKAMHQLEKANAGLEKSIAERTESLRRSEELFRAIFNYQSQFSALLSLDHKIIHISKSALRGTGRSLDQVVGTDFSLLATFSEMPETQAHWRHLFAQVLTGVPTSPIEAAYRTSDGNIRYSLNTATLLRSAGGEPEFLLVEGTDITERKRLEQAVVDRDSTLQLALDAAYAIAFVWDIRTNAVRRLFSSEASLPATTDGADTLESVMQAIWPEDRETFLANVRASFGHPDGLYRNEFRLSQGNGDIHWITEWGKLERNKTGEPARLVGISMDITDRKRHEDHIKLMMHELNHRVKNTLAMIQSIVSQTLRRTNDMDSARLQVEGRLQALATAHDMLTREKWEGAAMADVVQGALAPYFGTTPDRVIVAGPSLRVAPQFAVATALVLHELGTNAVKYGALSNAKGKVHFTWKVEGRKTSPMLAMKWKESGGPPVVPPTRQGFGSKLISLSFASEVNGEVKLDYARTGLVCTIRAGLPQGRQVLL